MSTYRCDCGDTDCPSCGTLQGTYTVPTTKDIERQLLAANRRIKQLCGMVNNFSNQLALGNKVKAADWIVE